MKKNVILLLLLVFVQLCYGQGDQSIYEEEEEKPPIANLGLGVGLDYGGIGGRIEFTPLKRLNVYAGLGYALVGFGYNFGAQLRVLPGKRVCPIVGLMYGYNGVIKIVGNDKYDKIYYGTSLSGGIELHSKRNSNFFNFELVVPFREQAFYDDWDKVKQNPSLQVKSEPLPVAFSIGYHFALE